MRPGAKPETARLRHPSASDIGWIDLLMPEKLIYGAATAATRRVEGALWPGEGAGGVRS